MVNLVIDHGNTITKIALFEEEKIIHTCICKNPDLTCFRKLFDNYQFTNAIFSGVKDIEQEIFTFLEKNTVLFIILDHKTPLPVKNNYKTPETLGADRLAAVIGADNIKPGKPLLVIDAGTAITYDFINNSAFYGGNISPGLKIRFHALHNYTARLPLLDEQGKIPLLGIDTTTAIRSGIVNGIIYEMKGIIEQMNKKYADLSVFLTGGDAIFFETKLKSHIFADNFLVLKGLNRILNYNVTIQ